LDPRNVIFKNSQTKKNLYWVLCYYSGGYDDYYVPGHKSAFCLLVVCLTYSSTLKMDIVSFSTTSANIYRTTWPIWYSSNERIFKSTRSLQVPTKLILMGLIKLCTILCINYIVWLFNKQVCNQNLKCHYFYHEICCRVKSESFLAMEYHLNSVYFKIQLET
jgi:hypothetical protein